MLNWTERHVLTVLLATVHYLPEPHQLKDTQLFARGRLNLWDPWPEDLPTEDRRRISALLMRKPSSVSNSGNFYDTAVDLIDGDHGLQFSDLEEEQGHAIPRRTREMGRLCFEKAPGQPLLQLLEGSFNSLEKCRPQRTQNTLDPEVRGEVLLRSSDTSYRIPRPEIDQADDAIHVSVETQPTGSVTIDTGALVSLAEEADAEYKAGVVRSFLKSLELSSGKDLPSSFELPTGNLRLLNAPTGTGKSVFSETASILWASRGTPTALVVPRNEGVVETAYSIERHAGAAGMDLSVCPLFSHRSHLGVLSDLGSGSTEERREWLEEKIGYSCKLKAFDDRAPAARPGKEPCFRLQDPEEGGRGIACPFAARCPKMEMYRRAASADIVVTNHHAFLSGRVPLPVDFGEGPEKITMRELVLRRCGAVLIDEIDAYQDVVADTDAGDVRLTSGDETPTPFSRVYQDLNRAHNSGRINAAPPVHRAKQLLGYVDQTAPELRSLINRGKVRWPEHVQVRTAGQSDPYLARRLFGESGDEPMRRTRMLFEKESPLYDEGEPLPRWFREGHQDLTQALRPLLYFQQDATLEDLLEDIEEALQAWPSPFGERKTGADGRSSRAKVAGRILSRAVLDALERVISGLRSLLPRLAGDISSARDLADSLQGYSARSSSPKGPLGRRVYGFSFPRESEGRGQLKLMTFSGDPHRDVEQIGSTVSLGLAGEERTVLGLSATARFPDSPSHDSCGDLLLTHPDEEGAIDLRYQPAVAAGGGDSERLSVSGISGARRTRQSKRMGVEIADTLRAKLDQLAGSPETEDRARLLLCTNSYRETLMTTAGIERSGALDRTVKAVLSEENYPNPGVPRIPPEQIESMAPLGIDVLVAPLATVARGHNILQPGTTSSALGAIYLLVRPVPPLGEAKRVLTHVSYQMLGWKPPSGSVGLRLKRERKRAEAFRRRYQSEIGPFSHLDEDLRRSVVADTLVLIEQLAGRSRRGTDAEVYLVDGAFEEGTARWSVVIGNLLDYWDQEGKTSTVSRLHGPFLEALEDYVSRGSQAA